MQWRTRQRRVAARRGGTRGSDAYPAPLRAGCQIHRGYAMAASSVRSTGARVSDRTPSGTRRRFGDSGERSDVRARPRRRRGDAQKLFTLAVSVPSWFPANLVTHPLASPARPLKHPRDVSSKPSRSHRNDRTSRAYPAHRNRPGTHRTDQVDALPEDGGGKFSALDRDQRAMRGVARVRRQTLDDEPDVLQRR